MLERKVLSARRASTAKTRCSPSSSQLVPFTGSIASRVARKRSGGDPKDLRDAKKLARSGSLIDLSEEVPSGVGDAGSLRDQDLDQLFGSMSLGEVLSDAANKTLKVNILPLV